LKGLITASIFFMAISLDELIGIYKGMRFRG
jgi:hypothetical protein